MVISTALSFNNTQAQAESNGLDSTIRAISSFLQQQSWKTAWINCIYQLTN